MGNGGVGGGWDENPLGLIRPLLQVPIIPRSSGVLCTGLTGLRDVSPVQWTPGGGGVVKPVLNPLVH
jgi:hypothetical protein